jgi:hypothetical protein
LRSRQLDVVEIASTNLIERDSMARRTILVSDISGKEIDDKDAAQVVITYSDARRGRVMLDVNASEVDDLAKKGTKQARRGRRPGSAQPTV